ncbi:TIGR03571 family LLM class oxidoreductase [uncultured Cohaesibacter sp.]|uniref:TIGR03571 family LLM class oxidoreductase n=1 Tax=uncultured Cohaesibacter sp. TaxID=1002546 RepID=UPI0029C800BF|nr:TIGR03571 family LLM class oxidoreductase [uncultured Cohaesibacter sp.]
MVTSPLSDHPGWSSVFRLDTLTFGIIGPIEGYPDTIGPRMESQDRLARKAETAGFASLWLRDVPFEDPTFGDLGQVYDPMVYAGWLAAQTSKIAIGTAGIVAPLRNPVDIAKQAASLDRLTQSRFILGLSSGDRAAEYPAFNIAYEERAARFREAHEMIKTLTRRSYPQMHTEHFGQLHGALDLVPKPSRSLPMIAVGRAGQSVDWLGTHMDAWIWHFSDPGYLPKIISDWRRHAGTRPYGYGSFFALDPDPNASLQLGGMLSGGRKALTEFWLRQRDQGVAHVALNLKPMRRPASEMLEEFGEHIIPRLLS